MDFTNNINREPTTEAIDSLVERRTMNEKSIFNYIFYDTIIAHFDMTFYDIFKTSSTAFKPSECSRIMCLQS